MTRDAPRHGPTGEPIDTAQPVHDPRCDGHGWINRDSDPAVPCLDCKTHLRKQLRRAGARHTEDR